MEISYSFEETVIEIGFLPIEKSPWLFTASSKTRTGFVQHKIIHISCRIKNQLWTEFIFKTLWYFRLTSATL